MLGSIITFIRDPSLISRQKKKLGFLTIDILLLPIALWSAFVLRLGLGTVVTTHYAGNPLPGIGWPDTAFIMVASAGLVFSAQLYRLRLQAFDLQAIPRFVATAIGLTVLLSFIAFFRDLQIPRTVAVYFGLLFGTTSVLTRIVILYSIRLVQKGGKGRDRVAIYGAGMAGIQLASSLAMSSEVKAIGFVDDNASLHGVIVSGLKVRPVDQLEHWAKTGRIKRVLIGTTSLPRAKRDLLVERMKPWDVEVQAIPSYVDLISGRSVVTDVKPVSPDQLLGRDAVDLDVPEIAKAYAGRNVMVTGAGGSIGSELCTQLLNCSPTKIVLFERSEFGLYEIERRLRPLCEAAGIGLVPCLGSVTDRDAVADIIKKHSIDIILHAAAYKHVPLVECNSVEGARNNVIGTKIVAEAAAHAGIERFILISTDKAVRPTNVMGATKRLAELVVGDLQTRHPKTRFSMVRFGNVLGSSGSVVPLFRQQIEVGGPVTVTHEEVTRYFMTIPEAARLVLLAGAFARGRDLFVLNMGEPVKIFDLARRMIEMSGRTVRDRNNPEGDIEIKITGLRPGEKLYEELLIDDTSLSDTPHEKILRANFAGLSQIEVAAMLRRVEHGVSQRDTSFISSAIDRYVFAKGELKAE